MNCFHLPTGPFILTFVLGPMLEENFRNAVCYADNGYMTFITSPIAFLLLLGTALLVFLPGVRRFLLRRKKASGT